MGICIFLKITAINLPSPWKNEDEIDRKAQIYLH